MQYNQPIGNALPCCPTFIYKLTPQYPNILGEGDVTSLILPDGSIQSYFVPIVTQNGLPYSYGINVPNGNNCLWTPNMDAWFVRSFSQPIHLRQFNDQWGNTLGDQIQSSYFSSNSCFKVPTTPTDYYQQKFHNDHSSSTTDIHYFYPNLRPSQHIKCYSAVQTDPVLENHTFYNLLCNRPCYCESRAKETLDKKSTKCACCEISGSSSRSSYMSVDSVSNTSRDRKNKKNKKVSKSRNKKKHTYCPGDSILKSKNVIDKSVSTYADQASGSTASDGRETQTVERRTKRSDVKTEIWAPINKKTKSSSKMTEACSSCYSDNCSCKSSTETDV